MNEVYRQPNGGTFLERDMDIQNLRFLVVDDHLTMRDVARGYLESMGVKATAIRVAEDGAQALEMLKAGTFDFVITDVSMPVMTGFGLLKAIKSDDSLKHLPVLMASAEEDADIVRLAELNGAIGYLVKPYTEAEFEVMVRKIVGDE
jgi:two-component system chemotaxis response regulator CheY